MNNAFIQKAAEALEKSGPRISQTHFTIGFDGFVDEILHAVDTRSSKKDWTRVPTLIEFAARISSAAGK